TQPEPRPPSTWSNPEEQIVERGDDGIAIHRELAAKLAEIIRRHRRHARHEQNVVDIQNTHVWGQTSDRAGQPCPRRKWRNDPFAAGLCEIRLQYRDIGIRTSRLRDRVYEHIELSHVSFRRRGSAGVPSRRTSRAWRYRRSSPRD